MEHQMDELFSQLMADTEETSLALDHPGLLSPFTLHAAAFGDHAAPSESPKSPLDANQPPKSRFFKSQSDRSLPRFPTPDKFMMGYTPSPIASQSYTPAMPIPLSVDTIEDKHDLADVYQHSPSSSTDSHPDNARAAQIFSFPSPPVSSPPSLIHHHDTPRVSTDGRPSMECTLASAFEDDSSQESHEGLANKIKHIFSTSPEKTMRTPPTRSPTISKGGLGISILAQMPLPAPLPTQNPPPKPVEPTPAKRQRRKSFVGRIVSKLLKSDDPPPPVPCPTPNLNQNGLPAIPQRPPLRKARSSFFGRKNLGRAISTPNLRIRVFSSEPPLGEGVPSSAPPVPSISLPQQQSLAPAIYTAPPTVEHFDLSRLPPLPNSPRLETGSNSSGTPSIRSQRSTKSLRPAADILPSDLIPCAIDNLTRRSFLQRPASTIAPARPPLRNAKSLGSLKHRVSAPPIAITAVPPVPLVIKEPVIVEVPTPPEEVTPTKEVAHVVVAEDIQEESEKDSSSDDEKEAEQVKKMVIQRPALPSLGPLPIFADVLVTSPVDADIPRLSTPTKEGLLNLNIPIPSPTLSVDSLDPMDAHDRQSSSTPSSNSGRVSTSSRHSSASIQPRLVSIRQASSRSASSNNGHDEDDDPSKRRSPISLTRVHAIEVESSDESSDEYGEESDSEDDDVPLAERIPDALEVQKQLRKKEKRKSKLIKDEGRESRNRTPVKPSRNPFQFSPDELSRKMTSKLQKQVASSPSSSIKAMEALARKPTVGHALLPQTDAAVRSRSKDRSPAPPLAPFVQDAVLTISDDEAAPLSQPATRPLRKSSAEKSSSSRFEKIFLDDPQKHLVLEIKNSTTVQDILNEVFQRGELASKNSHTTVWESWLNTGLERPLRKSELIMASLDSDNAENRALRLVVSTDRRFNLYNQKVSEVGDWARHEVKRGKWSKRWIEIRNQALFTGKSEKQRDQAFLCNIGAFEAYFVTASATNMIKPPKPYLLALKSLDRITIFEDKEDYVHFLAFKTEQERDTWIARIWACRTGILATTTRAEPVRRPSDTLLKLDTSAKTLQRAPSSKVFAAGSLLSGGPRSATSPTSELPTAKEWEKMSIENRRSYLKDADKKARETGKTLLELRPSVGRQNSRLGK